MAELVPREAAPSLLVPSSCLPGSKIYFSTSPKAACLPSLPSLPPQPQGDEGLTVPDMDRKPFFIHTRSMSPYDEVPRRVASLSELSCSFSHLAAEAVVPPVIKCSVPASPTSMMARDSGARADYFQKPGIFLFLEGLKLCTGFKWKVLHKTPRHLVLTLCLSRI